MSNPPFFSIVITSTRPRLVGAAIRSALAQDYDGSFEVVVSDNSTDGCRQLTESFNDSRLRYVRHEEHIAVVPHWNFAFSQARGDWQLLLCDDDAITPNLLSLMDRTIKDHPGVDSISWKHASYVDSDIQNLEPSFRLDVPAFSGGIRVFDASFVLARMFDVGTGLSGIKHEMVPIIPLAVYSRRVIDEIRKRLGGDFMLPPCPMTSGAAAALACSERTVKVDLPLTVIGSPSDSAGNMANDSTTFDTMHNGVGIEIAPIRAMRLFPSGNADALLRIQARLPEILGGYSINLTRYFVACHGALDELKAKGSDTSHEQRLYDEALAKAGRDISDSVSAAIARSQTPPRRKIHEIIVRKVRNAPRRMQRILGYDHRLVGQSVDARQVGVYGIADAASYIGHLMDGSGVNKRRSRARLDET